MKGARVVDNRREDASVTAALGTDASSDALGRLERLSALKAAPSDNSVAKGALRRTFEFGIRGVGTYAPHWTPERCEKSARAVLPGTAFKRSAKRLKSLLS